MDLGVDSLNDWHQIVENMFGVVHCRIHEVPGQEREMVKEVCQPLKRYIKTPLFSQ